MRYSVDGQTWSTVLDSQGDQRVFPANVDGHTPHQVLFDRPIRARFVKIVPWTWHNRIALRLDLLGCYVPVSASLVVATTANPTTTTAKPITTTSAPLFCHPCPDIPDELLPQCLCPASQFWNGTGCVPSLSHCPCVDGRQRYAVGALFQKLDDCHQCVCQLGGKSACKPPVCPSCSSPGFRSVLSPSPVCQCSCEPCPFGSKLCPSSNQCLEEDLWCNGVEDCPDDELDCPTCPFGCPEGYREESTGMVTANLCPVYQCVALETRPESGSCPVPECPPGYTLQMEDDDYQDGQQQGQQTAGQLNQKSGQELQQLVSPFSFYIAESIF